MVTLVGWCLNREVNNEIEISGKEWEGKPSCAQQTDYENSNNRDYGKKYKESGCEF